MTNPEVSELLELAEAEFPLGTKVRKIRGSSWHGSVVGYYSTTLTPKGIAIESDFEPGSVQIYPCHAIEVWARSEIMTVRGERNE